MLHVNGSPRAFPREKAHGKITSLTNTLATKENSLFFIESQQLIW